MEPISAAVRRDPSFYRDRDCSVISEKRIRNGLNEDNVAAVSGHIERIAVPVTELHCRV